MTTIETGWLQDLVVGASFQGGGRLEVKGMIVPAGMSERRPGDELEKNCAAFLVALFQGRVTR